MTFLTAVRCRRPSRRVLWSTVVLMALAVTVGLSSYMVLWLGDDVDYGFFIRNSIWDSYGSIDSVEKFFRSQGNHYWYVNGRATAHALVQLYCAVLGQTAFALSNALVYTVFVWLMLRWAGVRRPMRHPLALLCVSALVLLAFVCKMMPTTQIGFVWMMTLNLLWLRFYVRCPRHIAAVLAVTVLGIFAGNGQEALSIGISLALFVFAVHRRLRLGWRRWLMTGAYWLGTLTICLSPGTLSRASTIHIPLSSSLLYMSVSLPVLWLAVAVLIYKLRRGQLDIRRFWHRNALWIIVICVMMVFNLLIGVYSNRQLFGVELAALIVMLNMLPRHRFGLPGVITLVVLATAFVSVQAVLSARVRDQFDYIETEHKRLNQKAVRIDRTLASDNLFLREFRYYEEIVGAFNNDTHHSLQKLVRRRNPGLRTIHVWPAYMQQGYLATDTIHAYAPEHYFVISKGQTPDSIVVHSTILPPIGPSVTDTIPFSRNTVTGSGWRGAILLPLRPFARLDSLSRP